MSTHQQVKGALISPGSPLNSGGHHYTLPVNPTTTVPISSGLPGPIHVSTLHQLPHVGSVITAPKTLTVAAGSINNGFTTLHPETKTDNVEKLEGNAKKEDNKHENDKNGKLCLLKSNLPVSQEIPHKIWKMIYFSEYSYQREVQTGDSNQSVRTNICDC